MKKQVFVAMSGGVDSSVAAYLLKEAGYEVTGITMDLLELKPDTCCSLQAIADARAVADKLGIKHFVVDCKGEFTQGVINYFVDEYLRGYTPNPCVVCNSMIKFGLLLDKAKHLGAEYLATGHYARIEQRDGRYMIRKGIDLTKDQSYFLYRLTQEQLSQIIIPLGNYQKSQVREIAARLDLKTADKPESQEICFIPQNNYQEFIRQRASSRLVPGNIIDKEGNIIGKHQGIAFYTIGQRRGLRISANKPLYVMHIDSSKNAIIVGDKTDLYCRRLTAKEMNWVAMPEITKEIEVMARIRYLHKETKAVVSPLKDDRVAVEFYEAQQAITPGQSVVFYRDDIVVGGGIIEYLE
ncbi:MAG: tRNA 2-thiouridine(34) synthase MnmA [Candidatus Desantisbacteria bacterium]